MPSSGAYQRRFGSLIRAYELVGFKSDRDYRHIEINRLLRQKHHRIVAQTIDAIEALGGGVIRNPTTDLLTVNGEFTASIVISRCQQTPAGSLRWKIRLSFRATTRTGCPRSIHPSAMTCFRSSARCPISEMVIQF